MKKIHFTKMAGAGNGLQLRRFIRMDTEKAHLSCRMVIIFALVNLCSTLTFAATPNVGQTKYYELFNQSYLEKFIETNGKILSDNPNNAEANYNLGNTYCTYFSSNPDFYQAGIAFLQKAIALKPDYTDAYASLGTCYGSQAEYKNALDNLLIADKLYKENGNVWSARQLEQFQIADYAYYVGGTKYTLKTMLGLGVLIGLCWFPVAVALKLLKVTQSMLLRAFIIGVALLLLCAFLGTNIFHFHMEGIRGLVKSWVSLANAALNPKTYYTMIIFSSVFWTIRKFLGWK